MSPGEFDKKKIAERIKRLRTEAGLRQWQLAEMIGATQPAIHMYERGVLPEPKRLLELARIGNTTVEWILTGRHCEDGSQDMPRVPAHLHQLAYRFTAFDENNQEKLSSALRVINSAVAGLEGSSPDNIERMTVQEIARNLKDLSSGTLRVLCSALQIHEAVSKEVIDERIETFEGNGHGVSDETAAQAGRPPKVGRLDSRRTKAQKEKEV